MAGTAGEQFALGLAQARLEIEDLPSQARDHLCRQRRYDRHLAGSYTLGVHQHLLEPAPGSRCRTPTAGLGSCDQLRPLLDENVLRKVKSNRSNFHCGWLPSLVVA